MPEPCSPIAPVEEGATPAREGAAPVVEGAAPVKEGATPVGGGRRQSCPSRMMPRAACTCQQELAWSSWTVTQKRDVRGLRAEQGLLAETPPGAGFVLEVFIQPGLRGDYSK